MSDKVLFLARLFLGACFLLSGLVRLVGIESLGTMINKSGSALVDWAVAFTVVAQISCGGALLAGYRTRVAAGILILVTLGLTVSLYPFWSSSGILRQAQLAAFSGGLGIVGGLILLLLTGPGSITWAEWRRFVPEKQAARPKAKAPRPRVRQPKSLAKERAE